eukprot:2366149-Amphidinium_carterae.1
MLSFHPARRREQAKGNKVANHMASLAAPGQSFARRSSSFCAKSYKFRNTDNNGRNNNAAWVTCPTTCLTCFPVTLGLFAKNNSAPTIFVSFCPGMRTTPCFPKISYPKDANCKEASSSS